MTDKTIPNNKHKQHIHFIGIGGAGMSALAHHLILLGYTVSGCDNNLAQDTITHLKHLGCTITAHTPQEPCNQTPAYDILVYSSALSNSHPEMQRALQTGVTRLHRSQMLAHVTNEQPCIGVTGSHGKTTTSSMIFHTLSSCGLPTGRIVGGSGLSQARVAYKPQLCVIEADESDRSFLNITPTTAIITSISCDHHATYTSLDDVVNAFATFCTQTRHPNHIIACIDDENVQRMCSYLPSESVNLITYGSSKDADIQLTSAQESDQTISGTITNKKTNEHSHLELPYKGCHNLVNATAAMAAAHVHGIKLHKAADSMRTFYGVERRFTFRGYYQGARIFDDYAHHPREIHNALQTAQRHTQGKLSIVFHPHRYSRTQALWHEFVELFSHTPYAQLLVTDIYPAGEKAIPGITARQLVRHLKSRVDNQVHYVPYDAAHKHILNALTQKTYHKGDTIIFVGAGPAYRAAFSMAE